MRTSPAKDIWVPGAWHSGAPYSPGLQVGQYLFLSGAVPIDRNTGEVVGTDIQTQTAQVLDNLNMILSEAGCSLANIVKTTVFLTRTTDAAGMNAVYSQRFTRPYPARSTVEVGPLARPDFLVEIEGIAVVPE